EVRDRAENARENFLGNWESDRHLPPGPRSYFPSTTHSQDSSRTACSVRPTYSDSPGLQDLPEAISSKRLIVSGDDTAYSSLRGRIRNQALARHSERG